MRLRGGLLVGVRFVGVVVIRELGYGLLVLLEACFILGLPVFCCVSGDELSPVASLSGVELWILFGRLRLVLYVFCGWWFGPVVVRWVC
jgi:hypothetical protein